MNLSKKSFTLIELLLGLSIFSIVVLIIFNVFWAGMRTTERSEENQDYIGYYQALELISREIENSIDYDFSGSYPNEVSFKAQPAQIQFIVDKNNQLKVVRYFLDQPDSKAVYQTILGNVYKKNADVTLVSQEKMERQYLIREEVSLVDYVNSGFTKDVQIEIISPDIKKAGLRFTYQYPEKKSEEEGGVPPDKARERPALVSLEVDFIVGKKKVNLMTLKKDILIPTSLVW